MCQSRKAKDTSIVRECLALLYHKDNDEEVA